MPFLTIAQKYQISVYQQNNSL